VVAFIQRLVTSLLAQLPLSDNSIADQRVAKTQSTWTNSEGGTDDEEFRNEAIVDRVNTTMSVWMGMSPQRDHLQLIRPKGLDLLGALFKRF